MRKPTKAQLHARISHYETTLKEFLASIESCLEVAVDHVQNELSGILANAPSLEPVVTEDEPVYTDETVYGSQVDAGEEPATE